MPSQAPATSANPPFSSSSSRFRSRSKIHNKTGTPTSRDCRTTESSQDDFPRHLSTSPIAESSHVSQPSEAAPVPTIASALGTTPMASSNKRRKNRGGRKKRTRRKSFAVPVEDSNDEATRSGVEADQGQEWAEDDDMQREESVFSSLPRRHTSGDNIQPDTSVDRSTKSTRPRRSSMALGNSSFAPPFTFQRNRSSRQDDSDSDDDKDDSYDEGVPLLSSSRAKRVTGSISMPNYSAGQSLSRRSSTPSFRNRLNPHTTPNVERKNNVNYPPSIPGSPTLGPSDGPDMTFGDVMIRHELSRHTSDDGSQRNGGLSDGDDDNLGHSPRSTSTGKRAAMSSAGLGFSPSVDNHDDEDDNEDPRSQMFGSRRRDRRRRRWPDLSVLQDWSTYEKESRTEGLRAKKITEPQLINGRLRPVNKDWYLSAEEFPYRFTYFNEELPSTIHSQTISELVQSESSFRELFLPDRRVLSDDSDSSSSEDEQVSFNAHMRGASNNQNPLIKAPSRNLARGSSTLLGSAYGSEAQPDMSPFPGTPLSHSLNVRNGPANSLPESPQVASTPVQEKPVRLGERPIWWLDVMNPTEAELKVIAKAFGIHPLTAEDIMLQEAREKVELFRHYYFVNYRTFDQDVNSGEYLEPVNMYVVVFREGVLSFHFGMTPHAANVRRRVRQLRDYLIVSSDWISYAIIDDITDAFVPLIQSIEDEVDDIDDTILKMHNTNGGNIAAILGGAKASDAASIRSRSSASTAESSGDMLRRVGDCRKRVILLYRLLGNKADVIKGFAKRCNERWEVAPRSEIGLYLGDIQDHIVTMTANLSHYERMLSRSHANYLAQINIEMSERQEKTADVLGKLTVLGTIVLPMNIITGLWGMNVWVPGQGTEDDLTWFMWISTGLLLFGGACYLIAKRVYGIV
ncbi:hypothetical protein BROUX41_006384 [Berkeleyomyces rouxiae]|uniref:uncharacterized protein n=1 Tax=Berkeleyomyces rouxiae TaxID=2035830 RepID=UPI003B7BA5FF